MEKALPMNENENLLWGKWKGTGVSEHQRSRLLIQHRLEERKNTNATEKMTRISKGGPTCNYCLLQRRNEGFGGSGQGKVLQEGIEGNS